jgi:hypothetical protein
MASGNFIPYTWRSDHCGKFRACARCLQSGGQELRDVRPRFACVHPDQDMSRAEFLLKISADGPSGGIKGLIIQWRCAGDAAHSIGTKKFFRHNFRVASSRV